MEHRDRIVTNVEKDSTKVAKPLSNADIFNLSFK